MDRELVDLAVALFDIGCVKFGSFTLASGKQSPIYIDLRLLASYPTVLTKVAQAMGACLTQHGFVFDTDQNSDTIVFQRIAAIPTAGLPIGTAIAVTHLWSLIYPQKEVKDHGTGRLVEGVFNKGDTVVVVDDLITTAKSKFEAITKLEKMQLKIYDILVLLDRQQGGGEELAERGYTLHAVMTVHQLLTALHESARIDDQVYHELLSYFNIKD